MRAAAILAVVVMAAIVVVLVLAVPTRSVPFAMRVSDEWPSEFPDQYVCAGSLDKHYCVWPIAEAEKRCFSDPLCAGYIIPDPKMYSGWAYLGKGAAAFSTAHLPRTPPPNFLGQGASNKVYTKTLAKPSVL